MIDILVGSILGITLLALLIITIICGFKYSIIKDVKGIDKIQSYHISVLVLLIITTIFVLTFIILSLKKDLDMYTRGYFLVILGFIRILVSFLFFIMYFKHVKPILTSINLFDNKGLKQLQKVRIFYLFTMVFSFLTGLGPLISGIKLLIASKKIHKQEQKQLLHSLPMRIFSSI